MIPDFFGKYTYLFLNIICILFPLIFSFDRKVHFYRKWWRLFPSILIAAAAFLIWDEFFTTAMVWSFNEDYIIGAYIGHLPLEEWMFFVCIPFSCMFIYECLKTYFPNMLLNSPVITFMLIFLFLAVGIPNFHRIYTFITFIGAAVMLLIHFIFFRKKYLTFFYVMWLIHLIPFFLINGLLTGIPVVNYNDEENLGIRITTIPVEDAFYSMFLLLINLTAYEGIYKIRRKIYARTDN